VIPELYSVRGTIFDALYGRGSGGSVLFWRYAFDEAFSMTSQMWWRPMSPPVLVMLLTVTSFVVILVRAGVFGA
jgi:hypothetical protein